MATYLVHRCHYNNPSEKRMKKFDQDPTILDWFRNRWPSSSDSDTDYYQLLDQELGFSVYGLASIFSSAVENDLPPPEDENQLSDYLEEHLYVEGEVIFQDLLIQAFTDDDELEQAYYFFDDRFLKVHSDHAAFLMHSDWKLPTQYSKGGFQPNARTEVGQMFQGEGRTYFAISEAVDSANLDPIPAVVFPGVRLPDFPKALFSTEPTASWPKELLLIRGLMFANADQLPEQEQHLVEAIVQDPGSEDAWGVYSDWLQEHGMPPLHIVLFERAMERLMNYTPDEYANEFGMSKWPLPLNEAKELLDANPAKFPGKSNFQTSSHLVQTSLHVDQWEWGKHGPKDLYFQWWIFDDCWASGNPALAQGLLQFCADWRMR